VKKVAHRVAAAVSCTVTWTGGIFG